MKALKENDEDNGKLAKMCVDVDNEIIKRMEKLIKRIDKVLERI